MTHDRIRISDADRERAAARLREHFAEGRLSSDELDERIAAALRAKTAGDVRPIMAAGSDKCRHSYHTMASADTRCFRRTRADLTGLQRYSAG